ncbi:MAG TPA: FAD-binding oxidoreductase, partial [Xanthobacteraceae bacterium]|nr:FAD-binding oxidoreductase [Xanthobacteraceae bacterium]
QTGGRIFARSPAVAFERRGDRWVVAAPKGEVIAGAIILATNAYTDAFSEKLAPVIAGEMLPVLSWQMATAPLSDNVRKTIIPGRQAMSDTHAELYFARYDARNRLVTGGALLNPANASARLKPMLAARLARLWPQIGEVSFDYVWNGAIGMTPDFFPRIHRMGPQAYAWTGCNGRAVALAVALGRELAKAVQGVPEHELALPLSEPAPLPLRGVLRRLAPLMLLLYRYRDKRELAA